jgi:hypothetical protein
MAADGMRYDNILLWLFQRLIVICGTFLHLISKPQLATFMTVHSTYMEILFHAF